MGFVTTTALSLVQNPIDLFGTGITLTDWTPIFDSLILNPFVIEYLKVTAMAPPDDIALIWRSSFNLYNRLRTLAFTHGNIDGESSMIWGSILWNIGDLYKYGEMDEAVSSGRCPSLKPPPADIQDWPPEFHRPSENLCSGLPWELDRNSIIRNTTAIFAELDNKMSKIDFYLSQLDEKLNNTDSETAWLTEANEIKRYSTLLRSTPPHRQHDYLQRLRSSIYFFKDENISSEGKFIEEIRPRGLLVINTSLYCNKQAVESAIGTLIHEGRHAKDFHDRMWDYANLGRFLPQDNTQDDIKRVNINNAMSNIFSEHKAYLIERKFSGLECQGATELERAQASFEEDVFNKKLYCDILTFSKVCGENQTCRSTSDMMDASGNPWTPVGRQTPFEGVPTEEEQR